MARVDKNYSRIAISFKYDRVILSLLEASSSLNQALETP